MAAFSFCLYLPDLLACCLGVYFFLVFITLLKTKKGLMVVFSFSLFGFLHLLISCLPCSSYIPICLLLLQYVQKL